MKKIKLFSVLIFTCIASMCYGQQKQDDLLKEAYQLLVRQKTEQFLTVLEKINDVNMPVNIFNDTPTLLHTACFRANLIAVKAILAKGYQDINNNKNKMKTTPFCAISPITPEQRMKWTIDDYPKLVALAERDSVYRETIFKNMPKPSTNVADYPQPAEVAKVLIEAGADVNRKDGGLATLLIRAIEENNVALVKVLLDAKADTEIRHGLNVTKKQFPTALHVAAIKGNSEIIKLLVAAGADTNAELKEYLITEEQMKKYGIVKFEFDKTVSLVKIKHTPYTLAKTFGGQDAINTFEELGIKN